MLTTQNIPIEDVEGFSPVNLPYILTYKDGRRVLVSRSENQDLAIIEALLIDKEQVVDNIYFPFPGTVVGGKYIDIQGEWVSLFESKAKARRLRQLQKGMIKVTNDEGSKDNLPGREQTGEGDTLGQD